MAQSQQNNMEYRFLGNTGLKVSLIGYGDMLADHNEENQKKVNDVVKRCFELGVNFFDTAEAYGSGAHEKLLGEALKASGKKRSEYVLTTKLFIGDWSFKKPNHVGLSRKHLIEGVRNSLQRLQHDYVDVLYCHRPDSQTPLEETVLAFKDIFARGQCLYWATSEWSAPQIMEAYWLCEKHGVPKPIAEQVQYNMIHRERFEVEYAHLFDKFSMGTTIWGPLSGGLLTGKIVQEDFNKEGTRYSSDMLNKVYQIDKYTAPENIDSTRKMFAGLADIAKEFECTIAELAVAWTLKNKNVSTAILGLSKPEYVDSGVKSVEVYKKLTKEHESKIEELIKTAPEYGMNWKPMGPKEARRLKFY